MVLRRPSCKPEELRSVGNDSSMCTYLSLGQVEQAQTQWISDGGCVYVLTRKDESCDISGKY
jgi:hypothetical protein